MDMSGSEESDGEFMDAHWEIWLDDNQVAYEWLKNNGCEYISVISLRAGALLAAEAAQKLDFDMFVTWQPVVNGSNYLSQFLRLKVAAAMTGSATEKSSVREIKQELLEARCVEIAGYALSPDLAKSIEEKIFVNNPDLLPKKICWFEILADEDRPLPVVSKKAVASLEQNGLIVDLKKVYGSPFWGAAEIVENPSLLDVTTATLMQVTADV